MMKDICPLLPALLALFIAQPAPAADTTVIHAGWLLAVPGTKPVTKQSIVVKDGRISRVADGFIGKPELGADGDSARFLDLSGDFVLPGLTDAHVHLISAPGAGGMHGGLRHTEAELTLVASRHAEIALQAGFTTVVDLGTIGVPGQENAVFAVRDAAAAGRLAGPRVVAAGTPIAAFGQTRSATHRAAVERTIDYRSVCDGVADCRRATRHQVKRGSDIIVFFNTGSLLSANPVTQTMTVDEMRAIVDTAHSLGRKAMADGHHAQGIAAAVEAGADIVDSAHLYDENTFELLGDRVFLQSHIYGVVQAVGATEETLRDGLWGWLPEPILRRFRDIRVRPFATMEAYRHGIRNLAYASDAGVYTWGENAGDFVEFVQRGMQASDAIMTATVNAARMLGLESETGSIEPGKRADIVATGDSPLRDITELMDMRFVMRDGTVYRMDGQDVSRLSTPAEGSSP